MSDNIVVPQSNHTPGVIVTDGGGRHHHRGLEGKDASFFVLESIRNVSKEVADSRAESVAARLEGQIKTLEAETRLQTRIEEHRFQLALDKAERKQEMSDLRALILEKNKSTEDLLKDQEIHRLRHALAKAESTK